MAAASSTRSATRPTAANSLLVVGHNPSIERLALRLIGKGDAKLRKRLERRNIPTGALAVIDFEAASWSDIDDRHGQLASFHAPARPRREDEPSNVKPCLAALACSPTMGRFCSHGDVETSSDSSTARASPRAASGISRRALATPTLRLGVTGLARSGKTVFITALVHALLKDARLPLFDAHAQGRIARAYLEPQPDDDLPRFAYEDHVAALTGEDRHWPESTRRISQLRLTIDYTPHRPHRAQFRLAAVSISTSSTIRANGCSICR